MTRWIAAAGAFVVSLDSTVNIAFPAMAASFAAPPERMRWVIICYVLTYAVMSFVGGAAADQIGHARVFRAGAGLSAVAFVLAALAPTFGWLLGARVVQGVAGGLVYGTAPGLVTLASPPAARARALGFLNAAIGLGFTVGPVIAGVLVDTVGWRAIFHLRVPLAVIVLAWALALPAARAAAGGRRLVAPRDLLRAPVVLPSALAFLANAGVFAIWLLAPFYLVAVRGLPARAAGWLFMLTPLGTALGAALAGRLADRFAARLPMLAGLALEACGLLALSRADAATPAPALAAALFAAGLGLGIFQVPNMAVVMALFPAGHQGAAGGLTFLSRTLGVVFGVATLAQLFARRRLAVGAGAAFGEAFAIAGFIVALAVALALATRKARTA
jgi:MFS family permease